MALLAAAIYDPTGGAQVTKSTATVLAMTVLDSTNLRCTFTAPASGDVFVRIKTAVTGAVTVPTVFLGVIEAVPTAAFLRHRSIAIPNWAAAPAAASRVPLVVEFPVTGLTPSTSYTWDAAYGVEVVVAATNIVYGGPNNATTSDAAGAITFEVWEA